MNFSERIKQKAVELGFDLVGIAPAEKSINAAAYEKYVNAGYYGTMDWLAKNVDVRSDPRKLLDDAKSVVVVGVSYFTENPPAEYWNDPLRGRIARYAWGRDYHKEIQPRLKELAAFIEKESPDSQSKSFVDIGPVLEHDIAARAGLGFVGKHTLSISPGVGSYFFLGEVITTAELDYDEGATEKGTQLVKEVEGKKIQGSCGACRLCLNVCPTHAFPAEYVLDSRLCISYLTIELRESIPLELRGKMKNWIFGCDECQEVCPWVKKYSEAKEEHWLDFDPELSTPYLPDLLALDDDAFLKKFAGKPMMRTKRRGLLRNACVALGNSGDKSMIPVLEKALQDPEPLIAEHAQWAMEILNEG